MNANQDNSDQHYKDPQTAVRQRQSEEKLSALRTAKQKHTNTKPRSSYNIKGKDNYTEQERSETNRKP
jgi:hypothetical protein